MEKYQTTENILTKITTSLKI